MSFRAAVVGVVATFSLLAAPSASWAGGPGKWTQLATLDSGADTAGMVRTVDGNLHVVWLGPRAANLTHSYGTSTISLTGKLLATGTAITGWNSLEQDPQLVSDGSGMRLVFEGGIGSTGCYSIGLVYTATSADGSAWTLAGGSLSSHSAGIGNLAATTESDGTTPVAGFAGGHLFHVNVDPGCPATTQDGVITPTSGSAQSNPAIATDTHDGSVWMGWFQNFEKQGYWVNQILPTQTSPVEAPGSDSTNLQNNQPLEPVALTARPGGGVYMAYCVATKAQPCAHIDLWKVGTSSVKVVPDSRNVKAARVALAAGALGRLSVVWFDATKNVIHSVRTNPAATSFGLVGTIKVPAHAFTFSSVQAEGSTGRVDIIVNATLSTKQGFTSELWHTQVFPGLKFSADSKTFNHKKRKSVTFKVTDAGQPVSGAKVKCIGQKATTSTAGTVKLHFAKGAATGKHICIVTKVDYHGNRLTIHVS